MAPPTLLSMAQRAATRNMDGLQDVGDMSYDLVKPILKKVDNPQQLRTIEIASPHIADHDAELWKAFIARDIPEWKEKIMEPKNPQSWWKVYRKLIREEQRKKEEQEEQLKMSMIGIDKKKEVNQTQFVQKVIPHQSRGTCFADGIPNPRFNNQGKEKKPALQNATKGKDILNAIRKQSSNAQREKGMTWTQPAKTLLPGAKSQVKQAPRAMVRDHTKPPPTPLASQQDQVRRPAPKVFVPRHAPTTTHEKALKDALRAEQARKEERLRALASGGAKATSTSSQTASAPCANTTAALPSRGPSSQTTSTPRTSTSAALPWPAPSSHPGSAPRANTTATLPSPAPSSQSPRKALSPAPQQHSPAVAAGIKRKLSPSPAPQPMLKRSSTPTSIFMPSKKKKI